MEATRLTTYIRFLNRQTAEYIVGQLKKLIKTRGVVYVSDYVCLLENLNLSYFVTGEQIRDILEYGWTCLDEIHVRRLTYREFIERIDDTLLEPENLGKIDSVIRYLIKNPEERGYYIVFPKEFRKRSVANEFRKRRIC